MRVREVIRDAELEGINGVSIFPVQRPCDALVQLLKRCLSLLGNAAIPSVQDHCMNDHPSPSSDAHILSHYRMNHLALVVALVTLDDILS